MTLIAERGSVFRDIRTKVIYLLTEDPTWGHNMGKNIGNFGYKAKILTPNELLLSMKAKVDPSILRADAILANMSFPDSNLGMILAELAQVTSVDAPIGIVSRSHAFEARLQAVRYGAKAYFTHPAFNDDVIDWLDRVTDERSPNPFRILIVEENQDRADQCSRALTDYGMTCSILNDPLEIMTRLKLFMPDVILMSLYMNECAGIELTDAIRQGNEFQKIPVVFLTEDNTIDATMAMMKRGGDDFLPIPIDLERLKASVGLRAERFRLSVELTECDTFSKLLTHSAFHRKTDIALRRSRLTRNDLSLVMMDIDHFKKVNTSFGHVAGDEVIKGLARLLKQRLRHSDIIARYGGEEFAIALVETSTDIANKIVNHLREAFASIEHKANGASFKCTFSAGISAAKGISLEESMRKADDALYDAKQQGRNRISIST